VAQHAARAYEPVSQVGKGSLTLWGKHLVADVVTPKNLPWPGWSKLYELPSRSLRQFAHDTYDAEVNLRSLAASTLPVLTTEITIRTHHLRTRNPRHRHRPAPAHRYRAPVRTGRAQTSRWRTHG